MLRGAFIVAVLWSLPAMAQVYEPTGVYAKKYEPTGTYAARSVDQPKPAKEDLRKYTPWYVNGGPTPKSHLINDHGVAPSKLNGLSQGELDRLHGKMHGEQTKSFKPVQTFQQQVFQSGCPNGRCPLQRRR